MLSDLDRRIVSLLFHDPRATWDTLATSLGISPRTVARRVSQLTEDNLLKIVAEVAWPAFSRTLPVHVWIETAHSPSREVVNALQGIAGIQHLATAHGPYPVFATIHEPDEKTTHATLERIRATDGVARITTAPVLKCALKASAWAPPTTDISGTGMAESSEDFRTQLLPRKLLDLSYDVDLSRNLSSTERAIIALLQYDGRITATSIGQKLGISTSTAHRQLLSLLAAGWVRPRVETSLENLGLEASFVLRVDTHPTAAWLVAQQLAEHRAIRLVTQTAGSVSVVAVGVTTNREHLARLINEEIATIPQIRSIEVDLLIEDVRRYWARRDDQGAVLDFQPPSLLSPDSSEIT